MEALLFNKVTLPLTKAAVEMMALEDAVIFAGRAVDEFGRAWDSLPDDIKAEIRRLDSGRSPRVHV